jgi:DNA-binding MarR family transcriptional regulator
MAGTHTLAETERQVSALLTGKPLDYDSMAVVANLFRAASAARNHFERTILLQHDLSWTAFVVLWVTWIWEPIETRQIAAEGGFSKATLTGVLGTLEGRKLLTREKSKDDGRLVLVKLTASGRKMMDKLFPEFNQHESKLVSVLAKDKKIETAEALRKITQFAAEN